jgi:hypothetical protein
MSNMPEHTVIRSTFPPVFFLLTKWGDQTEEEEVDRKCSLH